MNIVMRSGPGHCTVGNMRGSGGNRVSPPAPAWCTEVVCSSNQSEILDIS